MRSRNGGIESDRKLLYLRLGVDGGAAVAVPVRRVPPPRFCAGRFHTEIHGQEMSNFLKSWLAFTWMTSGFEFRQAFIWAEKQNGYMAIFFAVMSFTMLAMGFLAFKKDNKNVEIELEKKQR